jgi:acyl dehydratase
MVAAKNLVTPAFGFHGEHDFWFNHPIRPGMKLLSRAQVYGVHQRSSGVAIAVLIETSDGDGLPVNKQYFVSFVPKARSATNIGQTPPPHAMPAGTADSPPTAEFAYAVDSDQAYRFAEASDDRDPYTTDEAAARAMGFATAILHGTCVLAFAGRAVIGGSCAGDPLRLRRFAARLANPLRMVAGQKIVTHLWRADASERVGYFASADATGTPVLTNGRVETA